MELDDGEAADALVESVKEAIGKDGGTLAIADRKGMQLLVPVSKVAYVQIQKAAHDRRVGFGPS